MKNAERYITPELKTFEDKALSAQERALARERRLYEEIARRAGRRRSPRCSARRSRWHRSTCSPTHAEQADALRWTQPRFSAEPMLAIRGGRHPVVEGQVEHFIPNDLSLGAARRMLIVTGPNMGGKSTYMRQTAVIALLAYCGLFVPATDAEIGAARRDLYPHRRRRRSRRRPLDVHGRDDRGRLHPQPRDAEQPGADRRNRPRHLDLRRPGAGMGHRARARAQRTGA